MTNETLYNLATIEAAIMACGNEKKTHGHQQADKAYYVSDAVMLQVFYEAVRIAYMDTRGDTLTVDGVEVEPWRSFHNQVRHDRCTIATFCDEVRPLLAVGKEVRIERHYPDGDWFYNDFTRDPVTDVWRHSGGWSRAAAAWEERTPFLPEGIVTAVAVKAGYDAKCLAFRAAFDKVVHDMQQRYRASNKG